MWATMLLDVMETGTEVVTIPGKRNVVSDAIGCLMSKDPSSDGIPPSPMSPLDDDAILRLDRIEDRRKAFVECHCGPIGGHFSLANALKWIKCRFSWPDLDKDVADWLSACDWCKRNGRGKSSKVALRSLVPSEPWELVGIDIVGPITIDGEKHFFFAGVDGFSKTFVAGAMKPTTDDLVAAQGQLTTKSTTNQFNKKLQ